MSLILSIIRLSQKIVFRMIILWLLDITSYFKIFWTFYYEYLSSPCTIEMLKFFIKFPILQYEGKHIFIGVFLHQRIRDRFFIDQLVNFRVIASNTKESEYINNYIFQIFRSEIFYRDVIWSKEKNTNRNHMIFMRICNWKSQKI